MSKTYTVLDFETTGLDYRTEQIIEVYALQIDEKGNMVKEPFHRLVALEKEKTLSSFITQLTGIREEDLKKGKEEKTVLEELVKYIGTSTVIAQCAPFDLSFLSRGGFEPKAFICTRTMARLAEPNQSPSLDPVTKRLGIKLVGHHRAENDVKATIQCYLKLKNVLEKQNVDYHGKVMDEVENREGKHRRLTFTPKATKEVLTVTYIK